VSTPAGVSHFSRQIISDGGFVDAAPVRFIEWFILALGSKIRSEVLSLIDSASLPISWHPHLRELVILQLLPR
jgi:hypothetical protein